MEMDLKDKLHTFIKTHDIHRLDNKLIYAVGLFGLLM